MKTFLFTDIEGSTRRWELDPDGMRDALEMHDTVILDAIESHGGHQFKHTGDGAAAAFDSASDAVAAAIAAQRTLELPVRMGLASGDAQWRDGQYFGSAVNRAARVMSAGHGRQILLADSTAALVDTATYIDLGVHTLRDISTPMRLTQVAVDGLPVDFPSLRTVGVTRGNRVAPTSRLVGRAAQLAALVDTVRNQQLVTLTGPGGVGKTRLSNEVADVIADEFADGTWIVELAATSSSHAVPALVADALNVTVEADVSPTDSILHSLAGRTMLILLDNCEHVLPGVQVLADAIRQSTATVTMIATSRENLGIAGERVWPVPPLEVGVDPESEAVALFIERARAVNPHFDSVLGSDDLATIASICRDLDGLALAIELAAARTVSMTPHDLAQRLDHRFQLLSRSPSPIAAGHHRTLYDTVGWSYDLLDDDERRLLARCSVFASGFELESVRAVAESDGWGEYELLDFLDSLTRKSLLVVDLNKDRTRYRLLETIRQFAEERLDDFGQTTLTRRAHAEYFAGCSQAMWEVWNGSDQLRAIDWVDVEFAELRAGFRWATDHGEIETAARIASHTAMLSFVILRLEPVSWVDEIVEPATAADLPQLPRVHTAACVAALAGGHQDAVDHARVAIELEADPWRDPFEQGWSLFWEAIGHRYLGDLDRWFGICERLSEEDGLARIIGRCGLLGTLAGVGRQDEAMAISDSIVRETKAFGTPFWIAWARASWGRAHASRDPVASLAALRACLDYTREYRIDYIGVIVLREIAALEGTHGGLAEAIEKFATVIDRYRVSGNRASAATLLGDITVMFGQLGRPEVAATVYGTSVPLGFSIAEHLPPMIDRLREELGDERFDECVNAGSAMPFVEAMAYTRRVLDVAAEQFAADG
ncbi:adenylate/guanylate cyclase domain-containing protein [Ilumatobacter nonamiensis]|uniref:adenylate/guanylate cyclase domain-containing protein n=1 Tax=Ilumatobacter nonamiensis TaxID=467093 RepID=UPI00034555A2|nr:adenylate/guanylate cyclase domain-containing protein [Ilumatobacter nonamiensis]